MMINRYILLLLVNTLFVVATSAQTTSNWDQQLFIGNKVSWGEDQWRYSGELQSRFKDNYQALDNWYVEGVASFMPSKKWEIVPDFRMSITPTVMEYRPGIGILRKHMLAGLDIPKGQIVQQLKYQTDISSEFVNHGLRYILFYNHIISEKLILTGIGGVFYSWKENYTGLEYIRSGVGAAYIIDKQHALNFFYFIGAGDTGDSWTYSGNFMVQLNINLQKTYKYIPAKYISF